jgi:hypothetical protein
MPDYKKISWQPTKKAHESSERTKTPNTLKTFLELCQKQLPEKTILKSQALLAEKRAALHKANKSNIEEISKQPFLVIFLVWTQEVASMHHEMVEAARQLLEHGFIGIANKNGKTWTIGDAQSFDHRIVIDTIRCQNELSLREREQLVAAYLSFIQWLSQETYGYFNKLHDPDLMRTQGRLLAYPLFINFLNALGEKERLVAKLLYFGGSRTLDEVLNLQLEEIDFEKKIIHFESQQVNYPAHIFADIQSIAGKKRRGRLFLGRQNAPLSPPTIFRNFKEAAVEVGLGQTFAPAILSSSI